MNNFDEQIQLKYANFRTPSSRVNMPLRMARLYLSIVGIVSPSSAAKISHNWFFTPIRSPTSKNDSDIINKASTRKKLTLENGVQFESFCWGTENPRILIVHGWESKSSHFRVFIDELIKHGFQVISFDAPGHGLSPGNWSDIVEYMDVIFALEKEYGGFYGAIGHSLGGLALTNAVKRGLSLEKAAIISAPTMFRGVVAKYAKILQLSERTHQALSESIKKYFNMDDSIWDKFTGYKGLENIRAKATIFHDEDDDEVLSIESECLAQSWPDSTLIQTQGLGHRKIIKSQFVADKIIESLK